MAAKAFVGFLKRVVVRAVITECQVFVLLLVGISLQVWQEERKSNVMYKYCIDGMGQLACSEPSTANKLTELIDGSPTLSQMTVIRASRIPVVSGDSSYTQFLDNYLRPLKPCLISGLTTVWT